MYCTLYTLSSIPGSPGCMGRLLVLLITIAKYLFDAIQLAQRPAIKYRNKVLKSPTNKNNLLSSQLGQPYRLAQLAVLGLPLD